ncbi:MAG: ABC transporter substrate-binding protein [Candidatus Dormibacteria bacterium]
MKRVLAAGALALLAACGSPGPAAGLPGATPQPPASRTPVAAPAGLVTPGTLTVAADYHFAPQSYVDTSGRAAGFDVDLAGALASQMNLKLKVINIDDPSIIQGLTEPKRRYDMGVNQPHAATTTGGILALSYFSSGQALLVRSVNTRVKGFDTICGLKVWASPGSDGELAVVTVNDKACHDRKAQVTSARDDVEAAAQLADGKIDVVVDDYPAAVLLAGTNKGTRVVPGHTSSPVDLVFPPGGEAIRDAVSKSFGRLVSHGTFKALLKKWSLDEGALPAAVPAG